MFTFPTRIFYRRVPGFATDCPCGVWCRGLTTWRRYVGPLLGNLVENESRFVSLPQWKTTFFFHLNTSHYEILYFRLPWSASQILLYFQHSSSALSFYVDEVLTLSITTTEQCRRKCVLILGDIKWRCKLKFRAKSNCRNKYNVRHNEYVGTSNVAGVYASMCTLEHDPETHDMWVYL